MECGCEKSNRSPEFSSRCISPAAVNQTEITIEISCDNLIEDDVLSMFKYCKMSGMDIKRNARIARNPIHVLSR